MYIMLQRKTGCSFLKKIFWFWAKNIRSMIYSLKMDNYELNMQVFSTFLSLSCTGIYWIDVLWNKAKNNKNVPVSTISSHSVSLFAYIAEKLRKMWEEEEEEKRKQTVPYAEPKSEYFWKTATNHIIIRAKTHGSSGRGYLVFCEYSEQTLSWKK